LAFCFLFVTPFVQKAVKNPDDELTAEDKLLKEALALAVSRVLEPNAEIRKAALGIMSQEIRTATSSMTSVPKPLKFLIPHYEPLKAFYGTLNEADPTRFVCVFFWP
jgi:26S proteasome regulatory subunit N1